MKQIGTVLVAAGVFAYLVTPTAFVLDDAYIALHSARVVVSGQDPVFGVPGLTGITSPAYILLLTGLLRLGFSHGLQALRIATMLGAMVNLLGVWAMTGKGGLQNLLIRAAVTVVGVTAGFVIVNSTNGLETSWAMAALTWLIVFAIDGPIMGVGLCAGVLPFLRPDLTPAAGLLLAYALWRRSWRERAIGICVAAIVLVSFAVWTHANAGVWLPQSIRAKALFYAQECLPWRVKSVLLAQRAGVGLASMMPLCIGLIGLPFDRIGRLGVAAIGISLVAYLVEFPSAVSFNYCRYLHAMLVPWCCWGIVRAAASIRQELAAATVVGIAVATVATIPMWWVDQQAAAEGLFVTARQIDMHVPVDAIVLVHDAGVISEFAHRRAVDLIGLKSPASIEAHARWTEPSCGAGRSTAIAAIARASGASYLIADAAWEATYRFRDGLSAEGVASDVVWSNPRGGYSVYRLLMPEP